MEDAQRERELELENFSSIRSIWIPLTASPCYTTNTTERQRERERLNLVLYNTGSYKPCSTDGRKMERKRAGRVKERDILNRVLSADRWTMERTRGRGGKRSGIMYW